MVKQTVLAKKRRGPPPTGKGVQVVVRLQPEPLGALDIWAQNQADHPTRAEAIRRLVELGLTVKTRKSPLHSEQLRSRARELAEETIDKVLAPSTAKEERTDRKHQLLKRPGGPGKSKAKA